MRYFTAKGDSGTTKLFSCPDGVRLPKSEAIFDALGELDLLNALVGLCRVVAERAGFRNLAAKERSVLLETLRDVQETLFIAQAELAGAKKRLPPEKVAELEKSIERYAGAFPPIHSFVIPGATELGARLDIARAVSRRAERAYLRCKGKVSVRNPALGAYLNRLSSLLYVLARFANHAHGAEEQAPTYR